MMKLRIVVGRGLRVGPLLAVAARGPEQATQLRLKRVILPRSV